MKIILAIVLISSFIFGAKLTRSGDYVIDDQNKLMWQDNYDTVKVRLTQAKAIEYCEELSHAGFSDWHLPSRDEYKTIINKKRKDELMIDRAFKYILPENYWASDRTWTRNFGLYGYFVFFKSGAIYYQNRTYKKFVRCVRNLK